MARRTKQSDAETATAALAEAKETIKTLQESLNKLKDELLWEREMSAAARKGHEDKDRLIESLKARARDAAKRYEQELDVCNEEWKTKYSTLEHKCTVSVWRKKWRRVCVHNSVDGLFHRFWAQGTRQRRLRHLLAKFMRYDA